MMKIIVTIGPASVNQSTLKNFSKKTNLFRLNGSHGTIEWHKMAVKSIRKVCPNAFILMDIPGIKPRTNNAECISIGKDQEVVFGQAPKGDMRLAVELTKELPDFKGDIKKFSLNDGQFEFDFVSHGKNYIAGRSRSAFTLLQKKGLNLPNSLYDENKQLDIYHEFLDSIIDIDIDGLGLSFVQTGELVSKVRKLVPNLALVAKVENSEGLRNCPAIVIQSDAIMIDRGDLAAEIGFNHLFSAINRISDDTKTHGKPLIMATENLETMLERNVPSKSEVMSIAHSASIGVDCIMLSEETATSTNSYETVTWLHEFVSSCERINKPKASSKIKNKFPAIWKALSNFEKMPIIIVSKSGYALFDYFSILPEGEVTIITNNLRLSKICKLYANKVNLIQENIGNFPSEIIWDLVEARKSELFDGHDQLAVVYVSRYINTARANTITIFDRRDFIF